MRLLNVQTLKFHVFPPKGVPCYVIASHRWLPGPGEHREATFQDVRDGKNTHTEGYQKIEAFATYIKAEIPGTEWLWIDTCCINKQDAQELSEAINSMFRWYSNAVICLAYLVDVMESADTDLFAKSEWFSRGWTLQELLAPRAVVFLSLNWNVIGHKGGDRCEVGKIPVYMGAPLNPLIAEITGITEAVLGDFQRSSSLTVEQRLEWMTGRETTREEDMWYCLFGIFDAPMGANYGEGGERAQGRLLAAIEKDDEALDKLPVASGAVFDDRENELVSECLPGTRVDLLRGIDEWADQSGGACIFWLSGVAGTGKSTIFKSAVQKFKDQGRLAASFCFKRGEGDRGHAGRLITTISLQLARRLPDVRKAITSVLAREPDIIRKGLRIQFQKLLLQPLERSASPPATGPIWIIGIDALDECDEESDIAIILDLLSKLNGLKSANFRLFVTSRPDLPLRLGFSRMPHDAHHDVRLEEVAEGDVRHDISVYLRHNLAQVRDDYSVLNGGRSLGQDWPGEVAVERLVKMAQPLFIFAATVCRLLSEPDEDPRKSLQEVLEYRLEAPQLDRMYLPILERLLRGKHGGERERAVNDFQRIVGAIVVLNEPLSIPALSRLLRITTGTVHSRLHRLHSVLEVPSAEEELRPVRPLHLSFRDYLIAPDTRGKTTLWIDEASTHRMLALDCLQLLHKSEFLEQDICGVEEPGTRRIDVTEEHVAKHIPADVAYASCNWVWHLVQSGEKLCVNSQAHQFLQSRFLHWLEALSWLDRLANAVVYITDLLSIVQYDDSSDIAELLSDAKKFILQNRYIIDIAPLQVYHSAMIFAPVQSTLRKIFGEQVPRLWSHLPTPPMRWNPEMLRFEGDDVGIYAVAFSSDGKTLVSASTGTVRLWNVQTGEQTQEFVESAKMARAVAISPDGRVVTLASTDATVRLWNTQTGKQMKQPQAFGSDARIWALSSDGRTVALSSEDNMLRLWDTYTDQYIHELQRHDGAVTNVAFSHDGHFVVSVSDGQKIRIWRVRTGEQLRQFVIDDEDVKVRLIALSPCCQVAMELHPDNRVVLWNARTRKQTQELPMLPSDITCIAFSLDEKFIAVASRSNTVQLWEVQTGAPTHIFDGHTDHITAMAFSPDMKAVASASASEDGTIRLWNLLVNAPEEELGQEKHHNPINEVAFSPDGEVVASASDDGKVRLWDSRTGQQLLELKGHEDSVLVVAFSPDGLILASGSRAVYLGSKTFRKNDTLLLWDARTGQKRHRLREDHRTVHTLSFSSDGRIIASSLSGADLVIHLWDVQTGEQIYEICAGIRDICPAVLSPDGQLVAITSEKEVTLWDVQNGGTLKLRGFYRDCYLLSFSPDGKLVASASEDWTVRVWDTKTGKQMRLIDDITAVRKITFSADGQSLQIESVDSELPPCSEDVCIRSADIGLEDAWVRRHGEDILWLPVEYRGPTSAVYGRTLVVGQSSGAVSFYRYEETSSPVGLLTDDST